MRTGLGTGSSRDLGQASKVPAIPAGTTGTPARDTRTAMPDLSGASLPSRLRVPSGKREDNSVSVHHYKKTIQCQFIITGGIGVGGHRGQTDYGGHRGQTDLEFFVE